MSSSDADTAHAAARRGAPWTGGNRIELLENGEAYFERVLGRIAQARRTVRLETFILFEDPVGIALHAALVAAARRGVQVDCLIDGWGSPDLSDAFRASLVDAGVRLHVFDPARRLFGTRLNAFRRMHRKIVVIDREVAYVGGINWSVDHLLAHGPEGKQDWAVEIHGPLVAQVDDFAQAALAPARHAWLWRRWLRPRPHAGLAGRPTDGAWLRFVVRDNDRHPDDIERQYRVAIRAARRRIWIANAYFFPGWRVLHDLRRAARRGVDVRLLLQGEPDMPLVRAASTLLYRHLQRAGVRILEYGERPLHGKVALVDDAWATVGSSNLDPTSLSLNLEANVFAVDPGFAAELQASLQALMDGRCREVVSEPVSALGSLWLQARSTVVFFVLRRFPGWLARGAPSLPAPVRHPPEPAPQARR